MTLDEADTFYVHRYEVFRRKYRVTADTMREAIAQVEALEQDDPKKKPAEGRVEYIGREYADEVIRYLVDVDGDDDFELSREFHPWGDEWIAAPDAISNAAFLAPSPLQSVMDLIEQTYAHDEETGERLDEPGSLSAADVLERLCGLEEQIRGALRPNRVLAIIEGGLVQDVFAERHGVELIVCDYDETTDERAITIDGSTAVLSDHGPRPWDTLRPAVRDAVDAYSNGGAA